MGAWEVTDQPSSTWQNLPHSIECTEVLRQRLSSNIPFAHDAQTDASSVEDALLLTYAPCSFNGVPAGDVAIHLLVPSFWQAEAGPVRASMTTAEFTLTFATCGWEISLGVFMGRFGVSFELYY